MNKQIEEALKMAIEALEEGFGTLECEGMLPHRYQETIQACKEALAEAESKSSSQPVAWIKTVELLYIKAHKAEGIKHWKTNLGLKPEPDDSPLYTHPATWQSLSDDEITKAICLRGTADSDWNAVTIDYLKEDIVAIARAIEQALKEKNHG